MHQLHTLELQHEDDPKSPLTNTTSTAAYLSPISHFPLTQYQTYAAVEANTSALLAFVKPFKLKANRTVNKHIKPSLTLSFETTCSATIDTINSTTATPVFSIVAARLNFCIEKTAIERSTWKSCEWKSKMFTLFSCSFYIPSKEVSNKAIGLVSTTSRSGKLGAERQDRSRRLA